MTVDKETGGKKAPGGPRNKGIPRPDPVAAKPGNHLWAQFARRMWDELYDHGRAEDRLGSNELAIKAKVAPSLVSGFFNGKKNISWEVCRALVVALGGDEGVWKPRWAETEQRYRLGVRLGEFAPLPGAGEEDAHAAIFDRAVADWTVRRHLPYHRARRLTVTAITVAGGIGGLTLYAFLLRRLRYGRFADAGLTLAALAGWFWWRARKSNTNERRRRGMLKKILSRAETIATWAETGLYLPPTFTVPSRQPSSAGRKARADEETFDGTVRSLYQRAGEDLVLLAEAGLGKTTQLAKLTIALVEEALREREGDPANKAIPVLLNLSGYRGEPLEEWLAAAIHQTYDVDKASVRVWLQDDLLTPLLDGLDQVPGIHRQECASQIWRFRQRCTGIAVGCRSRDYRLARTIKATLSAEIAAPNDDQVQAYLATNFDALSDVREALEADRSLWKLLRSPLMLNIIYHTYADQPVKQPKGWSVKEVFQRGSDQQRRGRIFDAYLRRMLKYRPACYTPRQTVCWLTWLARTLTRQGDEILHVEYLQPEVLTEIADQRKVHNIIIPARILLGIGMSFLWLFIGRLPVSGLLASLIILAGTAGPIMDARRKGAAQTPEISPVDRLDWPLSPHYLIRAAWIAAIAFTAALWFTWSYVGWQLRLVAGCGVGLSAAYLTIVGEPGASERPLVPNRPIRRSGMHAFITQTFWTFVVVTSALVSAPILRIEIGKSAITVFVVMIGIGAGAGILPATVMSYGGGAFLRHWTLRWLLYRSGDAPLRYVRFLHDAEERILLRRLGSGFTFPHRLLQEHMNIRPEVLLERLGLDSESERRAPKAHSQAKEDMSLN